MDTWNRVLTLSSGTAMVVTDLHGNWRLYQKYRDWFIAQYTAGNVQYIIFTGDIIHTPSSADDDASLQIVLDVMQLQTTYLDAVHMLLGNHEMVHIYHVPLSRGTRVYTPAFEAALGDYRDTVLDFFRELPFYVRTAAGVAITHAGAAATLSVDDNATQVFSFYHRDIFARVAELLQEKDILRLQHGYAKFAGVPYDVQSERYLAVTDPDDPRYDDLLIGVYASTDPDFELLWDALFTRCEKEYGKSDYGIFLNTLLVKLSRDFAPQQFLVAGHMPVAKGAQIVSRRHLRVASGAHARPLGSAKFLLFDTGTPVQSIERLQKNLHSIFEK